MSDCPFCEIVAGRAPATVLDRWTFGGITVLTPLSPVTPGHRLIIPNAHVPDALADPRLTGMVFERAASVAAWLRTGQDPEPEGINLITSAGAVATQTVMHLHVHVVPRRSGDGLLLPWSSQ